MEVTIPGMKDHSAEDNASTAHDLEAVLDAYWIKIYHLLDRMLGDRFEAEDLALETFWRFYEAPPNQVVNIGGWLYRVATNLGLNSLRMNRRRKENERRAAREYLESPRSANPADQVERRLERLAVQNILAQMKTREAHLLILRHSGLSYKELAKILEVAPSSIGTLLARAEAEFERRYRKLERGES